MIVCTPRLCAALFAALLAGPILAAGPSVAQPNNNFFGNLFKPPGQVGQPQQAEPGAYGTADPTEQTLRIERLESQLRQMTGQVEQLQYRNQQLEAQVKRYEMELDYRGQQPAGAAVPQGKASERVPAATPPAAAAVPGGFPAGGPVGTVGAAAPLPAETGGRRSDVFDPNANPGAPGMPQPLGATLPSVPLDANGAPVGGGGTQVAALPAGNSPKELYDAAYGYVLRQEYARAADSFRDFVERYPADRAAPDAYFWLGESDYQRQQFKEAAQSFLKVSTDYSQSSKAPDALLRLGQSLAALGETDAACATLNAVGNKYPRASASVRQQVEREQKRVRC